MAMNTNALSSFFVLLAIVAGLSAAIPSAFAAEIVVQNALGSSVPGCEETNECFLPYELTINIGDTVTWNNDDTAAHTATSGTPVDGPDQVFDSSLVLAGSSFSHTFDTPGTYDYFCMVHPWMAGVVIVQEAMAEEPIMEKPMEEEPMMGGAILGLDMNPAPFDTTMDDTITLSFTALSSELEGSSISPGKIDHLDYSVAISKDGNEIWRSQDLHDHDGNLELQITPTEGSFAVTGGQEDGSSSTGPYMVTGPVFMDNGDYEITAQIVGIEFKPLATPLNADFDVQVVPEFGSIAMIVLAVGAASIIAVTAKSRVFPKL